MIQSLYMRCDRILRNLFLRLFAAYRRYISPDQVGRLSRTHCRYWPSCSLYATQAFERYSFVYAVHLTVKRVLRCNPWHTGGYDPLK